MADWVHHEGWSNIDYRKSKFKKLSIWVIVIVFVIIIIVLIISSNRTMSVSNSSGTSFLSKINTFFSTLSLPGISSCPQIDTPILESTDKSMFSYYITELKAPPVNLSLEDYGAFIFQESSSYPSDSGVRVMNYYEKAYENKNTSTYQDGWRISTFSAGSVVGVESRIVICHKGDIEGENTNYFYCDTSFTGGIPYLSKTLMNPDGTIGKTIRKSFVNIYSYDFKFIKTICGKDPETIAEDKLKEEMRQLDNAFSLK